MWVRARDTGSLAAVAVGLALLWPAVAPAAPSSAAVDANGNPFTGGLGFDPLSVTVRTGGTVTWTNTEPFVIPHDATENHGLWAVPPEGSIAAGQSAGRSFDAGTFGYFCTIHGSDTMSGTVVVPIRKRSVRRHGRRLVRLQWGDGLPPPGQVFDVQFRKVGASNWKAFLRGTGNVGATLKPGDPARGMLEFRSRIRDADEAIRVSGYSPPVTVRL